MDKFLEIYNFPRLTNEEIDNLNRSITSREIKSVIRNLPTKKRSEPDGFISKAINYLEKIANPSQILPQK